MTNKETRPWGQFEVLYEDSLCKIKKITLNPKASISLQYHVNRKEVWTILCGEGEATVAGIIFDVWPGEIVDVPLQTSHRINNTSTTEPLIFIEVQTGKSFEESDIVRLEDQYGRV